MARVNETWGTADWRPVVLDVADDSDRSFAALTRYDVLLVEPGARRAQSGGQGRSPGERQRRGPGAVPRGRRLRGAARGAARPSIPTTWPTPPPFSTGPCPWPRPERARRAAPSCGRWWSDARPATGWPTWWRRPRPESGGVAAPPRRRRPAGRAGRGLHGAVDHDVGGGHQLGRRLLVGHRQAHHVRPRPGQPVEGGEGREIARRRHRRSRRPNSHRPPTRPPDPCRWGGAAAARGPAGPGWRTRPVRGAQSRANSCAQAPAPGARRQWMASAGPLLSTPTPAGAWSRAAAATSPAAAPPRRGLGGHPDLAALPPLEPVDAEQPDGGPGAGQGPGQEGHGPARHHGHHGEMFGQPGQDAGRRRQGPGLVGIGDDG